MKTAHAAVTVALLSLCACPNPGDARRQSGAQKLESQPAEPPQAETAAPQPAPHRVGTQGSGGRAGTYDPRVDRAPAAGPGAPAAGDVPGMGMSPLDHPVRSAPATAPGTGQASPNQGPH